MQQLQVESVLFPNSLFLKKPCSNRLLEINNCSVSGKDILIVRTHSYNGTSNPPIIDTYIDLSKVVRISAEPTIRGNDAFCDVKICTSEDGIGIILKMPDSDEFVTFPGEKEFLEKQGYCNSEIRLSLYDRAADAEKLLERITHALVTLSKMYGSNPEIGPLF